MEEVKQQVISLPRIGERAPDFEAPTSHGVLKLEDFKGSWLTRRTILMSYQPKGLSC